MSYYPNRNRGYPFQRNVWVSIGVALLLFFGLQIGYFYRDYMILDERKTDLEFEMRDKEAALSKQKFTILSKERQIFQLERQLRSMESKLRLSAVEHMKRNISTAIYIVTATYKRPTQKADLTRLSYTLSLVPNIFWILVEDNSSGPSKILKEVALRSKIRHTLLHVETPPEAKPISGRPRWSRPRGVEQRNGAIQWLRTNLDKSAGGVLYFADDDNTYDIRIFDEMRSTKKISVWPVAFVGELMIERPKIDTNNKVVGWIVKWRPERPYAIDMAGFAINLQFILKNQNVKFDLNSPVGYQETHLISQLISGLDELEPKADMCTKIYVWHTKTAKPNLLSEDKMGKSDDGFEV